MPSRIWWTPRSTRRWDWIVCQSSPSPRARPDNRIFQKMKGSDDRDFPIAGHRHRCAYRQGIYDTTAAEKALRSGRRIAALTRRRTSAWVYSPGAGLCRGRLRPDPELTPDPIKRDSGSRPRGLQRVAPQCAVSGADREIRQGPITSSTHPAGDDWLD